MSFIRPKQAGPVNVEWSEEDAAKVRFKVNRGLTSAISNCHNCGGDYLDIKSLPTGQVV